MTQSSPSFVLGEPTVAQERLALHTRPWVTLVLFLAGLSKLIDMVFISYFVTIWLHFYQV